MADLKLKDGLRFGVVTVMNAHIYEPKKSYPQGPGCLHADGTTSGLTSENFTDTGLCLDTLKIANLTMEGPTKTITGGINNATLLKYGKTMTLEMQDALGRPETLKRFFGCDVADGRISITDKFPGAFAIEGETYVIDQATGDQIKVYVLIPQFLPEAILTLTQEADGDAAVFDLNGTVIQTPITEGAGEQAVTRSIFYELRETPWMPKAQA